MRKVAAASASRETSVAEVCGPRITPPPSGSVRSRPTGDHVQNLLSQLRARSVSKPRRPLIANGGELPSVRAAGRRRGDLHELMVNIAAYSGLRQGELFALTTDQITPSSRVIDVDRKVIEVSGTLLTGLPKGCKRRKTIPLSIPSAPRRSTRWRTRSRPGSRPHAPRCKPAPTRPG